MTQFDPSEISNWANHPEANHQLHELIRRLILSTVPEIHHLDIPSGSAVWQSGWDGQVEVRTGNAWTPRGVSAWELSCQGSIGTKANADYRKRTENPQGFDIAAATFVFATLRQWSRKQEWIRERRDESKWADIRAFDASDIAAWLEQAPSVSAWFARLIGKLPANGYVPLGEWWQNWATVSQPNIDPELVLAGRQKNAEKVGEWVQQTPDHYYVQGNTREEAIAFVAAAAMNSNQAWGATLLAKALVVKSEDAWNSLKSNASPLVLIRAFDGNPSPRLATGRGHHVITPLYASETTKGDGTTIPRLGRDETVAALTKMGISETKSR